MATHDYVIANASGAAVRADLNNALAAIVSNNSNAAEPATTYAYMWWADTTNNLLKLRNSANDAWITLRELDGTLLIEDGSAATPGLAFADDTDTGVYRIGANQLGITTNGIERMRVRADGNIGVGGDGDASVRLWARGATTDNTAKSLASYDSSTTELLSVRNDGAVYTGLSTTSPYNLTIATSANAHLNSNGFLYRATSSVRYKTDIETLEDSYADEILNVRPVWFRSTAPGDSDHPNWGHWGFIAEEVAEVDPRLVHWKTHEANVELAEPLADGVQYDRFVPHLLNLIKRQKEQIEALETRIAALEAN